MSNNYALKHMLETLIDKRNKLAETIVVCHNEGYNIDNSKANLFYLLNIVSDCYKIVPSLSTIQQNKLLNLTRKVLTF